MRACVISVDTRRMRRILQGWGRRVDERNSRVGGRVVTLYVRAYENRRIHATGGDLISSRRPADDVSSGGVPHGDIADRACGHRLQGDTSIEDRPLDQRLEPLAQHVRTRRRRHSR